MGNLLANGLAEIFKQTLTRLFTYKFVVRVFTKTAWHLAKSTENKLDDEWVKATCDALDQKCE